MFTLLAAASNQDLAEQERQPRTSPIPPSGTYCKILLLAPWLSAAMNGTPLSYGVCVWVGGFPDPRPLTPTPTPKGVKNLDLW